MVLKLICWRVLCGFKDILRGKSNEVRCVTVKGHAVWSFGEWGMGVEVEGDEVGELKGEWVVDWVRLVEFV